MKSFGLSAEGSAMSLVRARADVAKCVLLCANCHGEVETGMTVAPRAVYTPAEFPGPPG